MKIRKSKRPDDYINVIPFIDVLLVLLIFFMVSSQFTHNAELRLSLPTADSQAEQQRQKDAIEIDISAEGNYSINGHNLPDKKPETLRRALGGVSGGHHDLPLILSADADATHQSVVTAMDIAGQSGFSKLSITTRRTASGK
jgi:biopolymer transport protein ExbD